MTEGFKSTGDRVEIQWQPYQTRAIEYIDIDIIERHSKPGMMSNQFFPFAVVVLSMSLLGGISSSSAQTSLYDTTRIANAVLPLPEGMRDAARVLGYDEDGDLVTWREGGNGLVCVADQPGDDKYTGVCYHESLEPFMTRGRELRAEGVEGPDVLIRRHEEMDAGTLALPESGAILYNMSMDLVDFDPETAIPVLYALYTPYATVESTGIPDRPGPPGAPWIMRMGTPSSHVMIIVPKEKGGARSEERGVRREE